MSNAISLQLLTSHKLYFEFTSQTQSIAHASSRLFSGRIPELEWAAEIEPNEDSARRLIENLNPSSVVNAENLDLAILLKDLHGTTVAWYW